MTTATLTLVDRHTGERLELRRIVLDGQPALELRGSLPARADGPPLHVHSAEAEFGTVTAGRITGIVDGRRFEAGPGESLEFPAGSPHRWWNEGDETLEFVGYARPLMDLDRYLQAVFEVVNAGPPGRPSLVYMAHALRRHRQTQRVLIMPRPIQALVFTLAYWVGRLTGAYRGTDWPGCPDRCSGAPLATTDAPSE